MLDLGLSSVRLRGEVKGWAGVRAFLFEVGLGYCKENVFMCRLELWEKHKETRYTRDYSSV